MSDDSDRFNPLNKAIVDLFFCMHDANSKVIDQINNQLNELINDIKNENERLRHAHIEIENIRFEDTKLYHLLQKKKPNYKFRFCYIKEITKRVAESLGMKVPRESQRKSVKFYNWVNQNWEKLEKKFEEVQFPNEEEEEEENED